MSERTRTEEKEDEIVEETQTIYGKAMEYHESVRDRVHEDYVVTSEEAIEETNEQGELSFYSLPYFDDVVLPDMKVFKERIPVKSGRHTHQGGFIILALEGEGESYVDGDVIPWEAGDMILIPFKPGGVEHQHFNRNDEDEPAEWLAINYAPHLEHVGALFVQNETYSEFDEEDTVEQAGENPLVNPEFANFEYSDWRDYEPPEETETLYDDFIVRRNQYRKQVAKSQEDDRWAKIGIDDVEWELNPQGKMKWYIHPAYDNHSVQSFFASVQDIPPGSKSGKQHRQGQLVHYIMEGSGHSVINGEEYEWSAGDYLGLPVTPAGNTIQHFNDNDDETVRMYRVEPFEHEAVGYDLGCGFKQLEACPEYDGDLPE